MHISEVLHELLNETKNRMWHVHRLQIFPMCLGFAAVNLKKIYLHIRIVQETKIQFRMTVIVECPKIYTSESSARSHILIIKKILISQRFLSFFNLMIYCETETYYKLVCRSQEIQL